MDTSAVKLGGGGVCDLQRQFGEDRQPPQLRELCEAQLLHVPATP